MDVGVLPLSLDGKREDALLLLFKNSIEELPLLLIQITLISL